MPLAGSRAARSAATERPPSPESVTTIVTSGFFAAISAKAAGFSARAAHATRASAARRAARDHSLWKSRSHLDAAASLLPPPRRLAPPYRFFSSFPIVILNPSGSVREKSRMPHSWSVGGWSSVPPRSTMAFAWASMSPVAMT